MPLYLWLDLGSILIPFAFSFHPRLRFNKEWRYVLPGIFASLLLYIIWDVIFTQQGVWGFDPEHLIGLDIIGLPLEEWLFFICIPYACLFTHHCIGVLRPSWKLPSPALRGLVYFLVFLWGFLVISYPDRLYSLVNFAWAIPLTLIAWKLEPEMLQRFIISYLLILLPFLLVNGVLTGSGLAEPIVWYNDAENLGIRIGTIPIEDFTYAFTMLLFPLLISRRIKGA